MNTFSRLSLFTLVCFGFALIPFVGIADAQGEPSLEVLGSTGFDDNAVKGDPVTVLFIAGYEGVTDNSGILLSLTAKNVNITRTTPNNRRTDPAGVLKVEGTLTSAGTEASITASWRVSTFRVLEATAGIIPDPDDPAPVLIVVNPPNPKAKLLIGDTFKQTITIENRHPTRTTLPLTAWQMDVVFNPLILAVASNEDGSPAIEFGDVLGAGAHSIGPIVSSGKISVSQARAGQTPLGVAIPPNTRNKTLLTITFEVLAVAEEPLGIHNVRLQSTSDKHNKDGTLDRISYSILVSDVFVATHKSPVPEDVNQDLKVDILDLVVVAGSIGKVPHYPRADVNGDGFVNVLDLTAIYASSEWGKTKIEKEVNRANEPALKAPSMSRNVDPTTIQAWIDLAQVADDGSVIFDLGIANLEALLATRIPTETRLLLNYPNPFNPETWIPYQLSEATDVTVTIHAMNGSLIRTLALGHQAAGVYQNKSQAAYWDGRNELGEQVASGLYFYTLTAGNFSATGKMLVRK